MFLWVNMVLGSYLQQMDTTNSEAITQLCSMQLANNFFFMSAACQ
jgi:hypothetical protein